MTFFETYMAIYLLLAQFFPGAQQDVIICSCPQALDMLCYVRYILIPESLLFCLQVVRCSCQGAGSSISGVGQGSIGSKEVHYVLRALGPAACRCPQTFAEVTKRSLRIALPPSAKRG